MALLLLLVAFNNIVNYGDNRAFVRHVMAMDTVFPGSTQTWATRSIRSRCSSSSMGRSSQPRR